MDFLRFLLRLPLMILRGIYWVISKIVGDMSWSAPRWMRATGSSIAYTGRGMRAHPGRSSAIVIVLAALIGGGTWGYYWYKNRPRPVEEVPVAATVSGPPVTDYSGDKINVFPMTITFSRSTAPLALVGKTVATGIQMKPETAGTWTWVNDRTLTFQPKEDWAVGQDFDVRFDPKVAFAEHVKVDTDEVKFHSADFTAKLVNAEFYQDPVDPTAKKAIVSFAFNHPVDTASFEKAVSVVLENAPKKAKPKMAKKRGAQSEPVSVPSGVDTQLPGFGKKKFIVTYDERKLSAFVHSEPLSIPKDDASLVVTVDKGVRAARGGPGIADAVQGSARVPGLYSLQVDSIAPTLVNNANFEPEQVLVVETSQSISEKDAAKVVTAWLLPVYNPKTPEDQRTDPYNWDLSQVGQDVLRGSEKLTLDAVPTEREFEALHSFKFHADPDRYIYVSVEKNLRSFGGYVLGNGVASVVRVPEYPRMLKFMADGALLSLNGEKRVSVVARNVPGMELEIGRVLPNQLQHVVGFNHGTYAKPSLEPLTADQITERFVQKVPFSKDDPQKAHFEGVDLGQYLDKGGAAKHGVFLLKLSKLKPDEKPKVEDPQADTSDESSEEGDAGEQGEGYDNGGDTNDDGTPLGDSRLIVVTDLGVIAKKTLDGSQDVFVQSIKTGSPVGDVVVDVVGRNGQTLMTQNTPADGHVHFDTLAAYTREKTPAMYVVHKGDDESFLPIGEYDRNLDFSRFDIGGERNAKNSNKLSAYLFTDRGIYRPGDTFHVGMIVRAANWANPLSGIPLQVDITDARGIVVESKKIRVSTAGFEEISYTTQESAPTGGWNVNLYIVKDGRADAQIGSVGLQVKEFMPDRMKADARLSQNVADGWIKPENLKVLFTLQNLFGTPAQNRRVEATLSLQPYFPSFRNYPDFKFFDPNHAKEGYSEPLGDRTTDEKGEAEFPLDLSKYGTSSYQLRFFGKGYEAEGGRNVAAETHALVSSLDYLIGAKTTDNMEFVARDAKRTVNLVAIGPDTKKIAVGDLKAAIVERRFVSILTKQDSGVYKYESKAKEIAVSEKPLAIAANGTDFDVPTDTPGNFALVIRNAHGVDLNRVEYTVAGEGNVSRSLERNAELQLTLSKHDFNQGEYVDVSIRAPYAGSGLITIERDRVYAHTWFHSTTTGSVQKIRVPADFEGNGYINVQFVRDPASDEIFMSPLSYGVVPFSVNRDARREGLTISAPGMVKPGEPLKIKLTAAQPTRAVVFAVDEGILQVARYKLGDPLDFFFRKRMLEVRTSQILDLILPEFSKLAGMAAPGGDADDLLARHLNPFKKKHQDPVAFWSGIVDVTGDKEFTYNVPDDFNGKLRLMAVAVKTDKIGIAQNSTTVRGDFVLSPNVPNLVAPGDEFDVSVGVANNLTGLKGEQIPVSMSVDVTPGLEVVGEAKPQLKLGEMREGVVVFRMRAKPELGPAKMTFHAAYNDKSAKIGTEVSVRPASAYRTDLVAGDIDKGSIDVKPLRDMYDAFAKRNVAASYTPLVLAQGLSAYLADFPHRCTEQLVSQGMPALVFGSHPEYGIVKTEEKKKTDPFQPLYAVLHSRQNNEGGFGLWTATPTSERFISVYTMLFLVEAKERGQHLPTDMLEAGNRYLLQLAADESDGSMAGLRERAFAIYLLTRQGTVTTNYLASVQKRLEENYAKGMQKSLTSEYEYIRANEWFIDGGDGWENNLAAGYLAASLKLLKQDKEAGKMIAPLQEGLARATIQNAYRFERYYDTLFRDASVLYLLAKHFPERASSLPATSMQNLLRPIQRGWFNTLSSAQTILALDAYASRVGDGKLTLAQVQKDGSTKPIEVQPGLLVHGVFDGTATAVRVANDADLHAWYAVTQAGFDRVPPTSELKQGLEIIREYTDTAGKAVTSVTLGQELDVHIKIRSTEVDSVGNVAIVDLLPGGFEAVIQPPSLPEDSTNADNTSDQAPAQPVWQSPVGIAGSTWSPQYADVRDDRVVIYGTATRGVGEFIYRIRATNSGKFIVPPAYGESMYDRTVQARSLGGTIEVVKK